MNHTDRWRDAITRAQHLNPQRIAATILEASDNGLRATTYDRGTPASTIPCDNPERCDDGPNPHSHHTQPDPTGNTATNPRPDPTRRDTAALNHAHDMFIRNSRMILDFVSGQRPASWADVIHTANTLMPGTIQAGIDVRPSLARIINRVAHHIDVIEHLAEDYTPRQPTEDEKNWTAGLADEDCCAWHLAVHRRYRRVRCEGKNICQSCVDLVLLADGNKPPLWLLEAEVDRLAKPRVWTQTLARWLDELGHAETPP